MPWIWNDETYWDRLKFAYKLFFKIIIPSVVLCFVIISLFMHDKLSWLEILLISSPIVILIYSFIDIFLQQPHPKIPDTYPKWAKTLMYITSFLFVCLLFNILVIGVLQHHYPILIDFACCDAVRNFPKLN